MISCTEVVGLSLSTYLKIDIDYLKYRSSIILVVATTRHKVQQSHNEQISLRRISSGNFTRELDKGPLLN